MEAAGEGGEAAMRSVLDAAMVPCGVAVVAVVLWRCWRGAARKPSGSVEVERKVAVDKGFKARLEREGARFKARRRLVDVYYDTPDWNLCLEDVWLRLRNTDGLVNWELKVGPGLSAQQSSAQYREYVGTRDVTAEVLKYFPELPEGTSLHDLQQHNKLTTMCRIATTRETYALSSELAVDIDATDDGHSVAELEVMAEPDDVPAAMLQIDEACRRLGIDPNGPPAAGKMETALRIQQPVLLDMVKRRTGGRPL